MQGSGNNLTVTIGADASQLNAEIERTKLQIQGLRKEARDAFKKGDTAGVAEYTNQIGRLQTNLTGINRTLAETGAVATATSNRISVSARSFRSLDQAILGFGRSVAGAQAGMAAFAAFRGLSALKTQIDEVRKSMLEIRDLAQQTAQAPGAVKAAENIATSLGRSASDADKMLSGVAETLAKVRTEAGAPIARNGVMVLTQGAFGRDDRGVEVLKGSERAVFDLAKAYEMLGVNARYFNGTQADTIRKQEQVFKAFQRAADKKLFDPVQLNEISKVLFKGLPADAALKLIPGLLKQLREETAKNDPVIRADIKAEEDRLAAWDKVQKILDEKIKEHNRLWTSVETASANALANFIKSIPDWVAAWERWKQGNQQVIESFVNDWLETQRKLQKEQQANPPPANPFGDPSIPALAPPLGTNANPAVARLPPSPTIQAADGAVQSFTGATQGATGALELIAAATKEAAKANQNAAVATQGAAAATQAATRTMTVSYGPGTGFPSPYGPASGGYGYGPRGSAFRETASPERGGDPREGGTSPYLQSYAPGMSNYQALPPSAVYPMEESAAKGWGMAAQSMEDAATASKNAAEASKLAADAWVQVSKSVGFAEGGYISGPGTGTSDSIPARLSNGEFVMRAAAVDAWGPRFMASLNAIRNPFAGFAAGGLVGRGFADGGLVAAGAGGTPVHLHLGGHSFALSGAGGVVDALVVEASRQHIRSAGVKPSWYGGRPGGH